MPSKLVFTTPSIMLDTLRWKGNIYMYRNISEKGELEKKRNNEKKQTKKWNKPKENKQTQHTRWELPHMYIAFVNQLKYFYCTMLSCSCFGLWNILYIQITWLPYNTWRDYVKAFNGLHATVYWITFIGWRDYVKVLN